MSNCANHTITAIREVLYTRFYSVIIFQNYGFILNISGLAAYSDDTTIICNDMRTHTVTTPAI